MTLYVYAWGATICYGIAVFLTKLTSKYSIVNPWLFNFLWNLALAVFFIPLAIYNHVGLPVGWASIVVAAFFNALFSFLFFWIISKLDVSVASPLYNFRAIFAVILGAILLDQNLNLNQIFYFGAIFISGMFATYKEKFSFKAFFNKAVGTTILAMFFLALSNVFIGRAMQANAVWTTTFWINWLTVLFLIPTGVYFYKDVPKIKKAQLLPVSVIALFSLLGTIGANIAYGINVGLTSIILALPISMLLAFSFALFMPKLLERHTLKVYAIRFAAACIMIFAALQLSS